MKVWIARNGCAAGEDASGPLDSTGRRQAVGLSDLLRTDGPRRLVSSPASACVATVEPLARATRLEVLTSTTLCPPTSTAAVVECIGSQPDRTVVCTHAEVMSGLLAALRPAGVRVIGARDADLVRDGAVWELDLGSLTLVALPVLDVIGCAHG